MAWWNEDLASPEAKEEFLLHFLKFGDGVDRIRDVLGAEWAEWRGKQESERQTRVLRSARLKELMRTTTSSLLLLTREIESLVVAAKKSVEQEDSKYYQLLTTDPVAANIAAERSRQIYFKTEPVSSRLRSLSSEVDNLTKMQEAAQDIGDSEFEQLCVLLLLQLSV